MFRRLSIALLAVTAFVPLSKAQMRGAIGRPVFVGHDGFARGVRGGIGLHHDGVHSHEGLFWARPFSLRTTMVVRRT